jgi:hypothetical protein
VRGLDPAAAQATATQLAPTPADYAHALGDLDFFATIAADDQEDDQPEE